MRACARCFALMIFLPLAGCALNGSDESATRAYFVDPTPLHPNETPELRQLIEKYAATYQVPVKLIQRVVIRESTHRPDARNGPYYGLMQILPATARGMGFSGQAHDLLDPETNLKYAVKYLRGAWLLADGSFDTAVHWYASGYYYEAKRQGKLVETGLKKS
ncbi:lytic transglycosylase domain-containing protein [Pseudooceanicola sediminis]|uniref:Lytic transglycosylase domain-containing protein n=1 Tax=Pseudooceanicola sediminis TaxID=2211117 RepID=A0A399J2C0_9RHOB|nr:lytic transglycosylase domain-containing protein [Pseudooceanicola sediminis]KAA2314600.1 lytic transglycosylase domain-containing protein [Puniceibacterium sp. HSS470]RII39444.1 lytic transglycosylase domain-containing protein [Pseudooceanicola sediminis]